MKRLAALLLAAGLLAGACGGDSGPDPEANPKEALISAFERLSEGEGVAMVLSFDATAESLNALGDEGSEELSEEDAQKLLDSSISILSKGKDDDAQFEMVVTIAGEEDVAIKAVDKVLYFQVDAEGIAETFGADTSQFDAMKQQAAASGMAFLEPALEGEWIAVTGAEELAKQFGGGAQVEEMEASQEQFLKDITQALRETAEVTTEGDDDAGTRLSVTLPIRDIYQRFTAALQQNPAMASLPFAQMPDASEVPDESVVMDVWVEDGDVTQVAFDFAQLAKFEEGGSGEVGDRAALLIEIEEFDGDVEIPDDAVEVSAQEIFQGIGGAFMPGMGGSSGSETIAPPGGGFDCDQLKGAPPSVIEQFAEECPELQNK